jgi:hypothetical protein
VAPKAKVFLSNYNINPQCMNKGQMRAVFQRQAFRALAEAKRRLHLWERLSPNDPRPFNAIFAAERTLENPTEHNGKYAMKAARAAFAAYAEYKKTHVNDGASEAAWWASNAAYTAAYTTGVKK